MLTRQNCPKKTFQSSGNWPKENNKLRSVYSQKLQNSGTLWCSCWGYLHHPLHFHSFPAPYPLPPVTGHGLSWKPAASLPLGADMIWSGAVRKRSKLSKKLNQNKIGKTSSSTHWPTVSLHWDKRQIGGLTKELTSKSWKQETHGRAWQFSAHS